MHSSYVLKEKFQKLLTPIMSAAVKLKLSANTITIMSFVISVIYAAALAFYGNIEILIFLPLVLLLKIALNALDGMVARFTHSMSDMGAALNDVCDPVSDILLFSAVFIVIADSLFWFFLVILILLIEYVALVVLSITHQRPTDGPFGKSDRAIFLGLIALAVPAVNAGPSFVNFSLGVAVILSMVTLYNRLKRITQCQDL